MEETAMNILQFNHSTQPNKFNVYFTYEQLLPKNVTFRLYRNCRKIHHVFITRM